MDFAGHNLVANTSQIWTGCFNSNLLPLIIISTLILPFPEKCQDQFSLLLLSSSTLMELRRTLMTARSFIETNNVVSLKLMFTSYCYGP